MILFRVLPGPLLAAFSIAILLLGLHSPITENSSVEMADPAAAGLLSLAALAVCILLWHTNRKRAAAFALIGAVGLLATAAFLSGEDDSFFGVPFALDDLPPLIALIITGAAVIPLLVDREVSLTVRSLLAGGLFSHTVSFVSDLGDGSVFSWSAANAIYEPAELTTLGFYCIGLLLFIIVLTSKMLATGEIFRFSMSATGRRLEIWFSDLAWLRWQFFHPGSSYADFYAGQITRRLEHGNSHRTLGALRWDRTGQNRKNTAREEDFFDEGLRRFNELMKPGLSPGDTVVDYGCGSLRIGYHFIRFLDPGKYWGFDVTDRFFTDGLALVGAETAKVKSPHLHVITQQNLERARLASPSLVFSIAVLKHVPEGELETYFRNLLSCLVPGARAHVTFSASEQTRRIRGKSWAYPPAMLENLILSIADDVIVSFSYVDPESAALVRSCRLSIVRSGKPS